MYKGMMFARCDDTETVFYFAPKDFPGLQAEPHSFVGSAGHTLQGYFYQYDNAVPGRLIVFDHGFGGGHRAYMTEIEMLCRHGYRVFAYDHTGCMESEGENTKGFSQSLNDLDCCIKALKNEMPNFLIYGGEDHYILDVFKNNGDGIISVITNFYGNEVYELIKDFFDGFENMTLYEYIQMLAELAFIEPSPAPIKYIMSKHNLLLNQLRLPLVSVSSPFKQLIDNILE
jgi:hypothetical protein